MIEVFRAGVVMAVMAFMFTRTGPNPGCPFTSPDAMMIRGMGKALRPWRYWNSARNLARAIQKRITMRPCPG
jgi:hypothetical protein